MSGSRSASSTPAAPARTASSPATAPPPSHPRRFLKKGKETAGLRPVLHGPRLARLGRHRPRHPRFRDEVLHRRGHLRPGRQQHPGLLHPGRHQVPGHHPRRQAASGPGDPAGAERPRHVLGLRLPAHRGAAPHDVEHVRPGHPALVPHDGGLRRPHLPAGQRGRETTLVKFHWKPKLGVHSLVWEEAQLASGVDPDFHRRDLYDAIEAGAFPEWELGIQVFPDTEDQTFEGIDLLDPTKLVPEELAPVQPVGKLVAQPDADELLRRDRAGRLPPRPPAARASTSPTTRCCRAACSPTSTRS